MNIGDGSSNVPTEISSGLAEELEEKVIISHNSEDIDSLHYDMTKKKYLLIFNHFTFDETRVGRSENPKDRHGTHRDAEALKSTFEDLGFEVKEYEDLCCVEIQNVIENLIYKDHTQTSCIALAIMTHGSENGYLRAKDDLYELRNITSLLEKIAGVPKLLFIQACRGADLDEGHQVEVDGSLKTLPEYVPTNIDFLILYATVEGYRSFRDPEDGSWMMQSLCKIFREHHSELDILHMITLVNKEVACYTAHSTITPSFNNKKQAVEASRVTEERPGTSKQNTAKSYYDMSKEKYLHIFNHYQFDKTREFGPVKPRDRPGTDRDVKELINTFEDLSFKVTVHHDLRRCEIINAIENLLGKDHSRTSCVALAILTHGSYVGYLYAKDEPYKLEEITKLLETKRLATIPKLLFLQVSLLADSQPPPSPTTIPPSYPISAWESISAWFTRQFIQKISILMATLSPPRMLFYRIGSWWSSVMRFSSRSANSAIKNDYADNNGIHDPDKVVEVVTDGPSQKLVRVPSHIDFLIVHYAADDHTLHDVAGSFMIKSLCSVVKQHHSQLDILHLMTLVKNRVAYEYVIDEDDPSLTNTRRNLETRYTLTKLLKLCSIET